MNPLLHAPRVLVFDSGVGGLSVLREIQQRLPACEFIYASDNEAFPYGTKLETELIARVDKVLHTLLQTYTVDIIVVACNTASTLTLPHIRSHFSQPIVGVVPAIKPAAARSRSKVIGLLATPATIARPYTHELIREHASDCTVISVGSSELVQMAEQKLRGQAISMTELAKVLEPFLADTQPETHDKQIAQQLDTLVLACTHFPLLSAEIRQLLPDTVDFIDSGEAIARRVEFLLGEHFGWRQAELVAPTAPANAHLALFTRDNDAVKQLHLPLAEMGIYRVDILSV
jgi:glutamate racemase